MPKKTTKKASLKLRRHMHIEMVHRVQKSIVDRFEDMERFIDFMVSAIEFEKESIKDNHKRAIEGTPEEQQESYSEIYAEDFFLVEDFFTEVSLYSFITIIYSYLESGLDSLCRVKYFDVAGQNKIDNIEAKEQGKEEKPFTDIRHTDMKGKGIERASRYLKKVFRVDFGPVVSEWAELKALAKLRNSIVHNDGYGNTDIIKETKKPKEFTIKDSAIKRHVKAGRVEITNNGKLVIRQEYAGFILKQVISFFKKIDIRSAGE